MYFYLIVFFIFNVLTLSPMKRSSYEIIHSKIEKENTSLSFTSLPEEMHNNICNYSSIESVSTLKNSCKLLNSYYKFESCGAMKYEDYSRLILTLIHSTEKNKEIMGLNLLKSNAYGQRIIALTQIYGKNIIPLLETATTTDQSREYLITKLKLALSHISEKNTLFKEHKVTINSKVDSFAIEIMSCANDCNELLDDLNNRLIHYLLSSPKYLCHIKSLVKNRLFDSCVKNKRKETPIHRACYKGNVAALKILIAKNNIPGFLKDNSGDTAFHIACSQSNEEIIETLFNNNFFNNYFNPNNNGDTLLHLCCESGNQTGVKKLIESKYANEYAFVIPNQNGNIPLHRACANGKSAIVKELMNSMYMIKERDWNIQNNFGNTPAHLAFGSDNLDMVKLLGNVTCINFTIVNKNGDTPLHFASRCSKAIIQELMCWKHIENHIFDIRNNYGNTPRNLIKMNYPEIII